MIGTDPAQAAAATAMLFAGEPIGLNPFLKGGRKGRRAACGIAAARVFAPWPDKVCV
jgi:hypothetical protein